jgi:para-aminobenzoate synthetase component II
VHRRGVRRADPPGAVPVHGKATEIEHAGSGIFAGLPSPLTVGRYHSLAIGPDEVPAALEVVATTRDGEVMAVRHREHPVWGVQFHPESVLTQHGDRLISNFLELGANG